MTDLTENRDKLINTLLNEVEPELKRRQCRELRAWFDSGMDITVIDAALKLGIGALNRRISDLVESGYPIHREWEVYFNRLGEKKRRMRYSKGFGDFDIDAELKGIDKAFASLKR